MIKQIRFRLIFVINFVFVGRAYFYRRKSSFVRQNSPNFLDTVYSETF